MLIQFFPYQILLNLVQLIIIPLSTIVAVSLIYYWRFFHEDFVHFIDVCRDFCKAWDSFLEVLFLPLFISLSHYFLINRFLNCVGFSDLVSELTQLYEFFLAQKVQMINNNSFIVWYLFRVGFNFGSFSGFVFWVVKMFFAGIDL